jgi:hypothetical protein
MGCFELAQHTQQKPAGPAVKSKARPQRDLLFVRNVWVDVSLAHTAANSADADNGLSEAQRQKRSKGSAWEFQLSFQ